MLPVWRLRAGAEADKFQALHTAQVMRG